MKTIELTQGKVALVDDADFQRLDAYKWFAARCQKGRWYAGRNIPDGKRQRTLLMHREIISDASIPRVDHWDCDALNNQRANLRPCTVSQNNQNARKRKDNPYRFKGVTWHTRDESWRVRIRSNGKRIWLGYFSDEEAGARAYDEAARKLHGEFARVNLPKEGEMSALCNE